MNPYRQQQEHGRLSTRLRNLILALAIILLVIMALPGVEWTAVSSYLPLHMLMETVAIVIAVMIYAVGWHSHQIKPDNRTLILSCLFLGVAVLDFGHMLSFEGMPAMITPADPEKAINFWLAARTMAAAGLLSFVCFPARSVTTMNRYAWLAIVLCLVAALHMWFLFFPQTMPRSFIEGEGLTLFKIFYELALMLAFSLAAILLWRVARSSVDDQALLLAASAAIMALSEGFFTLYDVISDVYALLGHVYKIIAFALLYRALVASGIEESVGDAESLGRRMQATLDAMPDMMFEVSADCTVWQYHSNVSKSALMADPGEFLGKNLADFMPESALEVCRLAISDIEATGRSSSRQYSLVTPIGLRRYEISGAGMTTLADEPHYILVVRDITQRYLSEQRAAMLLNLASDSLALDEGDLARKALDSLEQITLSKIGFLHMVDEDQERIELLAWSTASKEHYCTAMFSDHYPVSEAGIWADSIRQRRPVIVNDYAAVAHSSKLPEGHAWLTRFVSVPVFDSDRVRMILGVGNADILYDDNIVNTITLFGNELYKLLQLRRAQRETDSSRRILRAALDQLPVGIAINSVGEKIRFDYMNDKFPQYYRTSREALLGSEDFWDAVYEDPEQREAMRRRVIEDFSSGEAARMKWDYVPITREGQETRYVNAQNILVPEDGLSISMVVDVTEQKKNETELRIAATAFSSQEGIMITDVDQRILRVNAAFERVTGYMPEEVIGKKPSFFSSGRNPREFYQRMWDSIKTTGGWRGEIWNKRKSGEIYPQSLTITAVRNSAGEVTNYVGHFIDISDLKQAEEEISRLSRFDALTGLANRQQLRAILARSIVKSRENKKTGAVLLVGLDHFKTLNDTMGHDAGDELLVQVADRLQQVIGSTDRIARYGGDEFVLVLNDLSSDAASAAAEIKQRAQGVLAILEDNYNINGASYYTTSSIGVTLFSADHITSTKGELMKQANIALSQAKAGGRNRVSFFDPALESAISERAQLLADLREALQQQQFELYVQAQQDVSGLIIGAEALVRWHHPRRGMVSPADFIPLAEASGLILPLGRQVMRMGLDILQGWQQTERTSGLKLSLNLAARQFHEANFVSELLSEVERRQLDASKLMLEITESALLENLQQARQHMQRLNRAGVKFAIDDFGTGYSSLAYLTELPLNQLKIDQSFVRNMEGRPKDRAVVRTIIDMAYSMGMDVLAEGVETVEQRQFLLAQGCMLFQGYLIARPQPNVQFLEQLAPMPSAPEL